MIEFTGSDPVHLLGARAMRLPAAHAGQAGGLSTRRTKACNSLQDSESQSG